METGARDAQPFPWRQVIHTGLCLLRLSPHDFWALTPFEFHAMTGGLKPLPRTMARAAFERLMADFPDN